MKATYLEASAEVRYWEDAAVNGTEDTDGALIPLRKGDCWAPVIRLADGLVMPWPLRRLLPARSPLATVR